MEAQAAAHKMAAQQAAQAAIRGQMDAAAAASESPESPNNRDDSDEPTDLTLDAGEKEVLRMRRERAERERYLAEAARPSSDGRDREELDKRRRLDQSSSFDFRHLIPQMQIKTENY